MAIELRSFGVLSAYVEAAPTSVKVPVQLAATPPSGFVTPPSPGTTDPDPASGLCPLPVPSRPPVWTAPVPLSKQPAAAMPRQANAQKSRRESSISPDACFIVVN